MPRTGYVKIDLPALKVIFRVVDHVTQPRHIIKTVLLPVKNIQLDPESPWASAYFFNVAAESVSGSQVCDRIKKSFSFLKPFIHLRHILVHPGANRRTGGEKIFHDGYFARHIFFRELPAVLVRKGKRMHIPQGREMRLSKAGNDVY